MRIDFIRRDVLRGFFMKGLSCCIISFSLFGAAAGLARENLREDHRGHGHNTA